MIRFYFFVHRLLLGIIVFIIPFLSQSQDLTYKFGRALTCSASAIGYGAALDANGNIYSVGSFSGTLDADPGGAAVNLNSAGSDDIFITKLDNAGVYVWSIQLGGAYSDAALDLTTDAAGNVYVTGYFTGTVDFDPGPGVASLTAPAGASAFVAKYNTNGDYQWATPLLTGMAAGLALDAAGNVYVTGSFAGTSTINTTSGSATFTSAGANDAFVVKLDPTGACQWVKQMGGVQDDFAGAITVDNNGNIYSTGRFKGTGDYDPGPGRTTINNTDTGFNVYLSKLNANGDFVYVKKMETFTGSGNDIAVDGHGNVYLTGSFYKIAAFNTDSPILSHWVEVYANGASGAFVCKFNAAGDCVWATGMQGNTAVYGRSLALDDKANVYTTGTFSGFLRADPGVQLNSSIINSAGNYDEYISLLDSNGNYITGKDLGGAGQDESYGIAVDQKHSVYTVGFFNGTMDMDPGAAVQPVNSGSGQGVFISKLVPDNNERDAVYMWADDVPALGQMATGAGVTTDAARNVYIAGYFRGVIDSDPSYRGYHQDTAKGGEDMLIDKVDAGGNTVWTIHLGSTSNDRANKIAVDPAGNSYVTGYFTGTVDFDPGPGTVNLTSVDTANAFVLKLNTAGKYLWATRLLPGEGQSIAIDAAGNSYVTGSFTGTITVSTLSGSITLTSAGGNDIFVLKLDAGGNCIWVKQMGGAGDDRAQAIAVDGDGNIYTCGQSAGGGDFDPGTGVATLPSGVYISKLNPNGNYIWAEQTGATYSNDLAIDAAANVYMTGTFDGTVDFDPGAGVVNLTGTSAAYILKLNASGNYVWVKQLSSASPMAANGITVDASGSVYTTGSYTASMDADPGPGTAILTDSSVYAAYISKLDSYGNYVWGKSLHPVIKTSLSGGNDIAIDSIGSVLTIGTFNGLLNVIPGPGEIDIVSGYYPLQLFGPSMFLSKLRQIDVEDNTGGAAGPLPLNWITVNGHLNNQQQSVINFTVSETSVKNYSIEKMPDGGTFTSIGMLNSKGDGENNYSFTEATALTKPAWYRILQTDVNGHTSYSTVIRLIPTGNSGSIVVYPVPARQIVTLQITGDALLHTKALLMDGAGRPVQAIIINSYNTTINISNLPAGIYILQLANGTSVKMVKE